MNRIAKELREHHAALGFSDSEETWLKELREHHAALGFSDSEETWLTAAADEIERLREALRYYAKNHYPNVNDGPWGVNSNDWGDVARAALEEKE